MYFANAKDRDTYDCGKCRKFKPYRAVKLQCADDGFSMLEKKPLRIDKHGSRYPFCPGKATWYPQIDEVFRQCLVAKETGLLPKAGGLQDQSALFNQAFSTFIEKYTWRRYGRVWQDVNEIIPKVLDAVGKMLGGK